MSKEILFIDDEPFFASRYVEELEKHRRKAAGDS